MPGIPADILSDDELWRIVSPVRMRLPRTQSPLTRGKHTSAQRLGTDFLDYQSYAAGEDVRHVDWAVYARTGELFVRRYEDERSGRLVVLVDASGSMAVPHGQKWSKAFDVARALCWAGLHQQHEVILGCTGQGTARWLPPQHGTENVSEIRDFLGSCHVGGRSHIGAAVDGLAAHARNGTLCVVSDLLSGASGGADLISLDGWLGQIHLFQLTVAGELDVDAGVLDDPEGTGRVEFKADAIQRINDRVADLLE